MQVFTDYYIITLVILGVKIFMESLATLAVFRNKVFVDYKIQQN